MSENLVCRYKPSFKDQKLKAVGLKYFKYGMLLLLILIVGVSVYQLYRISVAETNTSSIRKIYLSNNELDLKTIPTAWIDILLKIEDPNFMAHSGFDISTPGAGLTTITQGLAKFMYFDSFKPGFAKIEQSLIARFVLNNNFTKDEQLEILFNYAYLGHFDGQKVTGFSKAAHVYFKKSFLDLSNDEYISLIAMLIGPNGMNVLNQSARNKSRVKRIHKVLNGTYVPMSVTDTLYNGEAV
jgi:membrane carboxypeptidase/penicillin-binding protein